MRKKGALVLLSVLVLMVFTSSFVSAAFFDDLSGVSRGVVDVMVSVFGPLLGIAIGDYGSSDFFFAKVMLLILLFVIINVVIKKIPMFGENKSVAFIVALVISILAVRYISESELTQGILLPYGTLGIALTTLLPFIIFFYFLHESEVGTSGRKAGWILFGVIFLVLWAFKYGEMSDISSWIYFFTLLGIAMAFFFDKSVHKYFGLHKLDAFMSEAEEQQLVMYQNRYLEALRVGNDKRAEKLAKKIRRLGGGIE